jgi:hypothetical protein
MILLAFLLILSAGLLISRRLPRAPAGRGDGLALEAVIVVDQSGISVFIPVTEENECYLFSPFRFRLSHLFSFIGRAVPGVFVGAHWP